MKLECSTEKLKEAVSKAEKITSKNSTLDSLKSILFEATGKTLKIRSTNLSLGLEIEIPAKIDREGVVVVYGEVINNTLLNIGNTEKMVSLEDKEGNIVIKNKKTDILIKTINPEDFPNIPFVEGESFDVDVVKFLDGIKSVFYSSAITDIKPEISSVFIYNNEDNLVFVSTDSFRLAEKTIKVKNLDLSDGLIIPYKNILEIIKLFSDLKGDIKVSFNKNQVSFITSGFYLTSRLIDGVFPDYKQIVPKDFKTKALILKKDLMEAIKLSNIFSDKFNQINLSLSPKDKKMIVSAVNKDVGENKTIVEGVYEGESIEMNFNHRYIMDCFQSINEDSVVLEFNESNKPVILKGNGDKTFMYLIMPMNR